MPPAPGTRLGPYALLSPLGSGGMGEVFAARDTRLDRVVAIKILRPELGDAASSARFGREARAIAALNHPHICTLHDIGREGETDFLVMERLEGETLEARLARGRLPLKEVLEYGIQIADALDYAHCRGIVHRDLKPANIMLTPAGEKGGGLPQAKLLDFGIARLKAPPLDADRPTEAVTLPNEILGTLEYMAPEQLEGEEVDPRADLFAFGAVLYEMLTGRAAFRGATPARLVAEILESSPPPLAEIRPETPPAVRLLVEGCLAKGRGQRWESAADARLVLRDALSRLDEEGKRGNVADAWRQRRVSWILPPVAIVAVVLGFILAAERLRPQPNGPLDVLSVLPPAGTTLTVGDAPQISPDGRVLAFVATDASGKTLLYVRERGAAAARPLPGTDDATLPFWSPDSAQLGFFARGSVKTTTVGGGRVQTLAPAAVPRGGTWSSQGEILFVPYPNARPQRVSASGGRVRDVPIPAGRDERQWFPCFLPDGRHYLYLSIDAQRRTGVAIRLASLDSTDASDVVPSNTSGVYAEPGYVLFRREGALVAQRFDVTSGRLEGTASVVSEEVAANAIGYQALFSASANGVIALLTPYSGWQLAWFDRDGRRVGAAGPPAQYNSACLTADGRHVVYDAADPKTGNIDLWSLDLARGVPTRLTFDPAVDFYPVCSRKDAEIIFGSLRVGLPGLFRLRISEPGSEKLLHEPRVPELPTDWSADGRWVLFATYDAKTSWDVWAMPVDQRSVREPIAVAVTAAEERNARFSPDGHLVAYMLQEAGNAEVMVQPFPPTGTRWQVSRGGGRQPVWGADGRTLYYLSPDNKITAVEVNTDGGFAAGTPTTILEARVAGLERNSQGSSFQVTRDGSRFLVIDSGDKAVPMTLLLNWPAALK